MNVNIRSNMNIFGVNFLSFSFIEIFNDTGVLKHACHTVYKWNDFVVIPKGTETQGVLTEKGKQIIEVQNLRFTSSKILNLFT